MNNDTKKYICKFATNGHQVGDEVFLTEAEVANFNGGETEPRFVLAEDQSKSEITGSGEAPAPEAAPTEEAAPVADAPAEAGISEAQATGEAPAPEQNTQIPQGDANNVPPPEGTGNAPQQ